MVYVHPDGPVAGNLAGGLAGLLAAAGVTAAAQRGSVEVRVQAVLATLGLDAQVADLRWGTLRLDADPATAHLLRYATGQILADLVDFPEVTKVVVRVRR